MNKKNQTIAFRWFGLFGFVAMGRQAPELNEFALDKLYKKRLLAIHNKSRPRHDY